MKIALLSFILFFSMLGHAAFEVPRLTGPVMDLAGMMSAREELEIEKLIRSANSQNFAQIQVLTLPSLEGEVIENASIKITDKWQLGTKEQDKGVLILVAAKERKIRIEVGQGLEGDIPDVVAKRIIAEQMVPLFRQGSPGQAINLAVHTIIEKASGQTASSDAVTESSYRAPAKKSKLLTLVIWLFIFAFLFISKLSRFGRVGRRGRGFIGSGGFGGGGFGGGGFGGGGGWSGGGGGFSGGGASGGW